MNTNTVTDGQLGQLAVKQQELFQRAKNGFYNSFDEMMDALQQVIEGDTTTSPMLAAVLTTETFLLTVDYGQSLEQMIAAGQYDWKDDNITARHFPITGKGVVEFEGRYFHFNRKISSENSVKEIEQEDTANPWMPSKIEHVLSHGKTFPEEQRKFPIVGGAHGSRPGPFLCSVGSGRHLVLPWFGHDWDSHSRFLAVRKVSGS